ncbi:MAG TPA: DJ-1/PfpI family protein [Candidatus Omnitrophota bacterium]|nr:DJ-1/PfpI family protein [Candidatus Omnitrophota bacterium]
MPKKALIILAEGFEEIEALTPIDVLRRAEVEVVIAGLTGKTVRGSHGVRLAADLVLNEYKGEPDALILPGGMPGSANLGQSKEVAGWIKKMADEGKMVAAICAAPALVLAPTGILDGRKATCYPGCERHFPSAVKFTQDRVCVDGNLITSQGPGSAFEFALILAEHLAGREKARTLREGMLVKG